jgi:hypothetical protein
MTEKKQMTLEEKQDWLRAEYLKATKYLADKGLVTESVAESESRYLVPIMAVWKINLINKSSVWVITGDLPSDHLVLETAETPRNIARQFSFKWQAQAENLLRSNNIEQHQFANYLIGRADGLYRLFDNDAVWQD